MNIFKLNADEVATLRNWGSVLMTQKLTEAKESLRLENCQREFCTIFAINEEWFAAMHMDPSPNKTLAAPTLERN